MHIQIGPVPAPAVQAWVDYARSVLAGGVAGASRHELGLDDEMVELFEGYLDEWETCTADGADLRWETELDPDRVEFVMHAFQRIAEALARAATQRGFPLAPAEGELFYRALVTAVVAALGGESPARGAYAEQLRDEWPGFKEER